MNDNNLSTKQLIGLMSLAYAFSFLVRMIWVWQFKDTSSFYWNEQLMINTNDGYAFASGVQAEIFNLHINNPRIPDMWNYGLIFFTTIIVKTTPMSIDTAILYMPTIISSLVVIPIILISKLYNKTLWGFFSALLGSITWSYYNRTMTGYYDTDMFSAMVPMFVLFFLMKSTIDFNLRSSLYAGIAIILYPFFYDQGQAIIYAMSMIYIAYLVWYHRDEEMAYKTIILVLVSLLPLLGIIAPLSYLIHLVLLGIVYVLLKQNKFELKQLILVSGILFLLFMLFGNMFELIWNKVSSYIITGTIDDDGLHFFSVNQTVREAGKIPFETFANRTSGSVIGVVVALIGYILLVIKHRTFILALPLIGIGIFSLWGGLRFTVYAVPVAGMSAVFLIWYISKEFINGKTPQIIFVILGTSALIYPNITHIIAYKTPTVLKKQEVEDLVKLDEVANDKDYTLTWWDYGYPIWYYSDTSTLIDGGKHNNDNYIISKIMLSSSQNFVANFSRLAVEKYANGAESAKEYRENGADKDTIPEEFKMYDKEDKAYHAGGGSVINLLLKNNQKDQKDPDIFLTELEASDYKLPPKSRDIFLYLPYRMLNIFPTITLFGNLDLKTGKKERDIIFYPSTIKSKTDAGVLTLANGIIFDIKKGMVKLGKSNKPLRYFIITENSTNNNIKVQGQKYKDNSNLIMVFMKSYNKFILMDAETFNSAFVQMFILGKYDKNLFELVVASPYSRIYKIKK